MIYRVSSRFKYLPLDWWFALPSRLLLWSDNQCTSKNSSCNPTRNILAIILFQLNCCFHSKPAIHYISSHRPHFAPPLLPHRCVSLTKWPCIKTGKKSSCIHHFSVRPFIIFQLYHVCDVHPKFLPSSPTYRILPYRHCHPLATIISKQAIKNGKKHMHYPFYSSFTHHFFNYINVTGTNPDSGHLLPHTEFCPNAAATRLHLL